MKKIILMVFCFLSINTFAQELPNTKLKDLEGNSYTLQDLLKEGKPLVLDFWATWCKPCIVELNTINEVLPDWEDEVDFKFVAVSVDDSRTLPRVAPFVKGRDWQMLILTDPNSELKRAMNVNNIPHTFIISPKGKIVKQHTGFVPGNEDEIFEELMNLKNEKNK